MVNLCFRCGILQRGSGRGMRGTGGGGAQGWRGRRVWDTRWVWHEGVGIRPTMKITATHTCCMQYTTYSTVVTFSDKGIPVISSSRGVPPSQSPIQASQSKRPTTVASTDCDSGTTT